MITFVWYWRDPYTVQIYLVHMCSMIIAISVYAWVSWFSSICNALRDLVAFVQSKKREGLLEP